MNFETLNGLYHQPLFDLISQSRAVHLEHWRGESVQRCSLLSIKTGGCSEDCAYCAQSAHYTTGVEREDLLPLERILSAAQQARAQGATRFCMGAVCAMAAINSSAFSKPCAKSANSAWKSALPSVKSAIRKRQNSRPPASPLTITTSIPRPIFIQESLAHTPSGTGSIPSGQCNAAACRCVAGELSAWGKARMIGYACSKC